MSNVVILGGGSIGSAVAQLKAESGSSVTLVTRKIQPLTPSIEQVLISSWQWNDVIASLESLSIPNQLIVTNGMLWSDTQMPEKRTEALTQEALLASFSANVLVTAACLQNISGRLNRDAEFKFLAVSAKVGSISDNRLGGWHAYRASKAALNMLVKTTAIEWQRRFPHAALATYHPGTTDSGLSKPFQQRVPDSQLKTPQQAALCLVDVLETNVIPEESGYLWSWDGKKLLF